MEAVDLAVRDARFDPFLRRCVHDAAGIGWPTLDHPSIPPSLGLVVHGWLITSNNLTPTPATQNTKNNSEQGRGDRLRGLEPRAAAGADGHVRVGTRMSGSCCGLDVVRRERGGMRIRNGGGLSVSCCAFMQPCALLKNTKHTTPPKKHTQAAPRGVGGGEETGGGALLPLGSLPHAGALPQGKLCVCVADMDRIS